MSPEAIRLWQKELAGTGLDIIAAGGGSGSSKRDLDGSFGAISVGSGLTLAQTMVLSLVMFTGASQFAFVGVATAGGSPLAAVLASLLLGVRNGFYGVPLSEILHPRGLARLWTAHFVIDETTAMAVGQATPRAQRYAFWATGVILFCLWQLGSLVGALAVRRSTRWPSAYRGSPGGLPRAALATIAAPQGPVVAGLALRLRWH
jgi:hypothetical protein